ncbi:accessory gene regulator ArgB-like protein [Paenibacillaceae bacterium WGS1546]|uniref:accessory gene regulator ArgB-like protein n=1 Tax=Cohnella sp. WGS1546 TaxID=3366810 RepID=UPI00372D3DE8
MFDKVALNIASWIKQQNPEQTASVAVMQFALIGLLNSALVFFIVITIGAVTGHFVNSLIASVFFVGLHFFSGGYHFKSALYCTLFSSSMIIASILIPLNSTWLLIVTIITFVIVAIFAPSNIENHARIPKKYFPILKVVSLCVVSVNLFLQSGSAGFAMLFQAMLLLPYHKLTSNKEVK